MGPRFYTNMFAQASRNAAGGIFVLGLVLVGLGFLIWILKELFAMLFAGLFCIAGIGCAITAVKMYIAARNIDKSMRQDQPGEYRENVQVHIKENHFEQ